LTIGTLGAATGAAAAGVSTGAAAGVLAAIYFSNSSM